MAIPPTVAASSLKFLLGSEPQELHGFDPQMTVLEWLRTRAHRTGTKEGCAEGDCGACTVAVGELHKGRIRYRAYNSCIQLLPTLDGRQLVTVEDLAASSLETGGLHPVQQAMVDQHGSQCGFCTPGFVMSLFTLFHEKQGEEPPGKMEIDASLAGNLCRCTGYAPIVRAAEQAIDGSDSDAFIRDQKVFSKALTGMQRSEMLDAEFNGCRFFAPRNLTELWTLLDQFPQAQLIAGATDVGLWMTKALQQFDAIIYLCEVQELKRLDLVEAENTLVIGAAVSYTDAFDALVEHFPGIHSMLKRLGAEQVRNAGTIGGNIANGSPIGDMPPALIPLGASLLIGSSAGQREIPLEDFFVEYGKQDLNQGECVLAISIPLPDSEQKYAVYKLSKRFDQDISSVCAGFALTLKDELVDHVRICFGGMAGTPLRAKATEQALQGKPWSHDTLETAREALARDYSPLSDWRASREYRLLAAQNLLRRFFLETTGGEAVQVSPGESA